MHVPESGEGSIWLPDIMLEYLQHFNNSSANILGHVGAIATHVEEAIIFAQHVHKLTSCCLQLVLNVNLLRGFARKGCRELHSACARDPLLIHSNVKEQELPTQPARSGIYSPRKYTTRPIPKSTVKYTQEHEGGGAHDRHANPHPPCS